MQVRKRYNTDSSQIELVDKAIALLQEGKTLKLVTKLLQTSDHTLHRFATKHGKNLPVKSAGKPSVKTEVRVFHDAAPAKTPQKRGPKPSRPQGKVAVMVCDMSDLNAVLEAALR